MCKKLQKSCIDTKFKRAFLDIYQRCNNKNVKSYKNYGGRGIKCEWLQYKDFYKDMYASFVEHDRIYGGINTSINRIDNNGNYCKENCEWNTFKEQQNNRSTNCIIEGKTLQQRSEELGIDKGKLRHRLINMGMSIKEATNYKIRNKSGIKGIIRSNRDSRWIVQIKENGKTKRKFFRELLDAKYFLDNALLPDTDATN